MNETSHIVISIKRRFALEMLSGRKTVELRRRPLRVASGTRVWIYSTAPYSAVELHAVVESVVCASPKRLWQRYRTRVGISRSEFDEYFTKAATGCALILRDVRPVLRAVGLSYLRNRAGFHPPQFFARLAPDSMALRAFMASVDELRH